jgi:hypothetical protein
MRCLSCNEILTDFEATRKSAYSKQYIDLCNACFASIRGDIYTLERQDLDHDDNISDSETEELDKDY